jgi:23S rRNA (cytidine1920-2'-O)/16S rRNA (cytidine1409-2'-O)-methyltransferase
VGASTGGFTDLMLQTGAARVYTVDSGKGQLHEKLRKNQKVICHEKVNARYLESGFLPEKIDVLTIDVSFISVTRVIPPVDKFLKKNGIAFILVKPQFEAERKNVMKGGVVKSTRIRAECVEKVSVFAEKQVGWRFIESLESPVTGPKGNRELMCVFFK